MGQYTIVKPKNFTQIKEAGLVDEREIAVQTKIALKPGYGQSFGGAVKAAVTAALSAPMPFIVALKGETVILVQVPLRGLFVQTSTVKQKEIDKRIEIKKEVIAGVSFQKVLGGKKLRVNLLTGDEILIDVTKKNALALTELVKALGFAVGGE
ncbi:MAG: hypothetical protein LBL66_00465 [Clostridiales bacterium]|jgi:hypothetical protein|nr:hypothetical protein [Clostridiales bacterium]